MKNLFAKKLAAWLLIIRIQFYPMSWIAYTLGASISYSLTGKINQTLYWLGLILLFIIEFITILLNEYFDYQTDMRNNNYSPFSGGSRMLVEGRLTFKEIRIALCIASLFILLLLTFLLELRSLHLPQIIIIGIVLFLGVGYTTPPFKFSYKGFGEIVVCFTHSFFVILCGFILQGGSYFNPLPWIYSIPLFFSILPAIILAGIPDRQSDLMFSKKTIAVILGPKKSLVLASLSVFCAIITGLFLFYFEFLSRAAAIVFILIILHTILLWIALYKTLISKHYDCKINTLMKLSLSYIIWFAILPLLHLYSK